MTDLAVPPRTDHSSVPPPAPSPVVTLRTASGQGLVSLDAIPAAAALTAAVVIAPRFTALAAIGALLARMSITLDGRS